MLPFFRFHLVRYLFGVHRKSASFNGINKKKKRNEWDSTMRLIFSSNKKREKRPATNTTRSSTQSEAIPSNPPRDRERKMCAPSIVHIHTLIKLWLCFVFKYSDWKSDGHWQSVSTWTPALLHLYLVNASSVLFIWFS